MIQHQQHVNLSDLKLIQDELILSMLLEELPTNLCLAPFYTYITTETLRLNSQQVRIALKSLNHKEEMIAKLNDPDVQIEADNRTEKGKSLVPL